MSIENSFKVFLCKEQILCTVVVGGSGSRDKFS